MRKEQDNPSKYEAECKSSRSEKAHQESDSLEEESNEEEATL